MSPVRAALAAAVARLREAGIHSPEVDARALLAHTVGCPPLEAGLLRDLGPDPERVRREYAELVERRARREPLQYILGRAPFGPVELAVGPGVFVPRPETETLAEWAVRALDGMQNPDVLDLCTGTGALAAYIVDRRPDAQIVAVELSPEAARWARVNVRESVELIVGDATDPQLLPGAAFDLVVANPPYVPENPNLPAEVYADPREAVFGGPDGLAVIRRLVDPIHHWLRPGGRMGIEHDDAPSAAEAVAELFRRHGGFDEPAPMADLAGRMRFTVASKLIG